MLNRFFMGLGAFALLTTVAFAQSAPQAAAPTPPQHSIDSQIADNGSDGAQNSDQQGGWFNWGGHHRHRGAMDGGPNGRGMGGPGMMMPGKGFAIDLGEGRRLHINCDNEPMKQCIESAQPLIDALTKSVPSVAAKAP